LAKGIKDYGKDKIHKKRFKATAEEIESIGELFANSSIKEKAFTDAGCEY
jgi:hypothetical protein